MKLLPRKSERRREARHQVKGSVMVLWGSPASSAEQVSRVTLVDISRFGAKMRGLEKIPQGSWVMVNDRQLGIAGRGTVRHCEYAKGMFEIGLEFSSGTGWTPAVEPVAAAVCTGVTEDAALP